MNFNQMHKIIKIITVSFVCFLRIFYNYKIKNYLYTFKNRLYTLWIRKEFKESGNSIHIQSPCYLIGGQYISIGENFCALERSRLECWDSYQNERFNPILKIGNRVGLGYNVHIGCINKILIGDNVLFGSNIFVTDHNHGCSDNKDIDLAPLDRNLFSKGPVIIEDNVWIGDNVSILPNVKIGKNAVIGANSVVTKDVPAYSVAGGIPAKVIRLLKSEDQNFCSI